MPFFADAGRIRITDTDGATVFDTDEPMFLGTDFVEGSLSLPQRTATDDGEFPRDNVNVHRVINLASINSQADTVVGAFKVTVSGGGQGVANLGWFAAGGTYVHYWAPASDGSRDDEAWHSDNKVGYTFFAENGLLKFRERVGLRADATFNLTTTITLKAVDIDYKLFAGTFV